MKAIQYTGYGDIDVLKLTELEKPVIKDDEVLVRISATTINPLDMKIRSGAMQKMMPVQFPYIPGLDLAGTIENAGSDVKRLKVGDKVYAATTKGGAYAEYIAIKEDKVAVVPQNITLNEAAALAVPVTTSHTFLVDQAKLQAGQRILIQGAAGGVGQVMVQVAKALGAYVIATASGEGVALVTSLGADEVIDYKKDDFTQLVKNVDLVIDMVGGDTQAKSFEVVKKGGVLLSAVMPPSPELAAKYGVNARFVDGQGSYATLEFGTALVQQGKIKPNVAKVMKLKEAATAQKLVADGGLNGKVVLTVD